jgi:phospholipid/cholesterol/gamma-HCH transport system ATP-binding protein
MVGIREKFSTSSLIISHDMKCVRMTADRVVVLMNGKCHANDNYDALSRSSDPLVRQFFE